MSLADFSSFMTTQMWSEIFSLKSFVGFPYTQSIRQNNSYNFMIPSLSLFLYLKKKWNINITLKIKIFHFFPIKSDFISRILLKHHENIFLNKKDIYIRQKYLHKWHYLKDHRSENNWINNTSTHQSPKDILKIFH